MYENKTLRKRTSHKGFFALCMAVKENEATLQEMPRSHQLEFLESILGVPVSDSTFKKAVDATGVKLITRRMSRNAQLEERVAELERTVAYLMEQEGDSI